MPITRQVKNVVKNYSTVEVKVREATSNDPWGPSSSLMSDIADQTYNVVAFSEIMLMIWKRLNDHGKNWRHVYKSLVLLDYILKTGSERVAQQCRENIFAIQTLKDFQFIDRDGKDQGMNVREKSKQLVALLKDEERLKNERTRAIKAKERLSQASGGVGSQSSTKLKVSSTLRESGSASDVRVERPSDSTVPTSRSWEPERRTYNKSEIEKCRPSNTNEEELQLQLALALSKQEADETKEGIAKDEQRFQLAVSESRQSVKKPPQNSLLNISGGATGHGGDPWGGTGAQQQTAADAWSSQPTDSWGASAPSSAQVDPWGTTATQPPSNGGWSGGVPIATAPVAADPWAGSTTSNMSQPSADPWGATASTQASQPIGFEGLSSAGPWGGNASAGGVWDQPTSSSTSVDLFSAPPDPWLGGSPPSSNGGAGSVQPFEMTSVGTNLPENSARQQDLLADHSTLVNLDSLGGASTESNPFFTPAPQPMKAANPFAQEKPVAPSLNQLRTTIPQPVPTNQAPFGEPLLPAPLIPAGPANATPSNPFL